MIRLFQADDHAIVRAGMQALIMSEPDMELVGAAADGVEAVRKIAELQPDVALLDLQMPRKGGLEAIPEIIACAPDCKILVVTSFGDDDHLFAAVKAGAQGYLLKDSSPDVIIHAIREVAAGRGALSADLALRVIQEMGKEPKSKPASPTADPLTSRELEILRLVAQGLTNQEIAEQFVVSERTVRTHVSNILGKLHLANRTQAALYALREGIADKM